MISTVHISLGKRDEVMVFSNSHASKGERLYYLVYMSSADYTMHGS